jgi:hypothetical protein
VVDPRPACGREACRSDERELSNVETLLQHVAHVRAGDKGNTSNVIVIAYTSELYVPLKQQLTAGRLEQTYDGLITGPVERFCVDHLWVLNFLLHGALGGGVSRSLRLDQYGKTMAAACLGLSIDVPEALTGQLRGLLT